MLPEVFTCSYIKSLGNGASTNKKSGAGNGLRLLELLARNIPEIPKQQRPLPVFLSAHHDLTVRPYCWEHEEIKQVLIRKPHSYRPDFTALEGGLHATRWKKRNRSYSAVNPASYSDNWLGKARRLVPCGEPTSFRLDLKLTPVWNSHLALLTGPRTSGQRP